MTGTDKDTDQYSDSEATRRMNAAVRRALATPHKPHEPLGKRKKKRAKTRRKRV